MTYKVGFPFMIQALFVQQLIERIILFQPIRAFF